MTASNHLGPWDFEPTREDGCAFAIYPETTSEPLAYVSARDGAEDIARRMAAAPELLIGSEALLAWAAQLDDAARVEGFGGGSVTAKRIRAALAAPVAKATGATS